MIPEAFFSYLSHELNRSRNTVEAYRRDLSQFSSWITQGHPDSFDSATVTTNDIRSWIASLAASDSPSTLRRKTQSLRSFYRWQLRQGRIASNPAADVILAKKKRHLPEFIREQEMEEILNAESSGSKENPKS